ncbi:MAG TPA: hypothetical protein VD999_04310 [Vitreimonas sp.]|nr:hypothetical protein [Vitreimonas sp.]
MSMRVGVKYREFIEFSDIERWSVFKSKPEAYAFISTITQPLDTEEYLLSIIDSLEDYRQLQEVLPESRELELFFPLMAQLFILNNQEHGIRVPQRSANERYRRGANLIVHQPSNRSVQIYPSPKALHPYDAPHIFRYYAETELGYLTLQTRATDAERNSLREIIFQVLKGT